MEFRVLNQMGRKQLNHVQYKRRIPPELVNKMDEHLIALKDELRLVTHESIKKHVEHALDKNNSLKRLK